MRLRGCTVRRYEQLETSPETIEQEFRHAICEHRQTDRLWQSDIKVKPIYLMSDAIICSFKLQVSNFLLFTDTSMMRLLAKRELT